VWETVTESWSSFNGSKMNSTNIVTISETESSSGSRSSNTLGNLVYISVESTTVVLKKK